MQENGRDQESPLPSDERDAANYTLQEAAFWLGVPLSTLRNWFGGAKHMERVLTPASNDPFSLSFWNLTECSVLATITRKHRVRMPRLRKAVAYVVKKLQEPRPLIVPRLFLTDGIDLFIEELGEIVCASQSGQLAFRQIVEASLNRITTDETGRALSLSPWRHSPDEPQVVMVNSQVAFGRPTLIGTGISAATILERFRANETIDHLAYDYGVEAQKIENLVRWIVPSAA